jgi:hypothetical protein
MPTYKVTLQQIFSITVEAKTSQLAARRASYYVGFHDDSTPGDRRRGHFEIKRIELEDSEIIDVWPVVQSASLLTK